MAVSVTASPVADRLQLLSQLLTDEGCSVTEQAERSTTERLLNNWSISHEGFVRLIKNMCSQAR